ncbi:MAG TPA: protein usg [Beijerinckiaceae bacterium]|nr:protein usg [Beijerinckiaceae bacterium]
MSVTPAFRQQMKGYGLTTAQILYRMPDYRNLLQEYIWQDYDLAPHFPELKKFLEFWQDNLEGPLVSVTICQAEKIGPRKFGKVDGLFLLH